MKKIAVVAAVIMFDDKILCVQRPQAKYDYISLKYEFPGGKIEKNETPEDAIVREIREELCMHITVDSRLLLVHHDYPDFSISLDTFLCHCKGTNLTLTEHIDYKWLSVNELDDLDWAAADLPIVRELQKYDFR